MAEMWREMSRFRRGLLVALAVMIVGFGVATPIMSARKGMEYKGTLLTWKEEGEICRYTGWLDGRRAEFTITSGRTVEYRWGDYTYGPYEVAEVPDAAPESHMTGLEIRQADQVLFRGGMSNGSSWSVLYDENGEPYDMLGILYTTSDGTVYSADGKELTERDLQEPGLTAVAKVALGEVELTHRGSFALYLLVTLLAVFNMFQICFPGIMFRWSIRWHVKDPGAAEPSDFYIAIETIEWVVLTVVAAVLYWMALTAIY